MARRVAIFEDNAEPEAGWVCKQHAADHFEYLEANRDTIGLAGGLRPDSDQWWNGGLWVMEVETRAQGQVADLCRCGALGRIAMTEDECAVREVVATWLEASKHGDTATVLSLMTDDVVFLVPGQKPFGKEAFAAASKSMADMKIDGTSNVEEIHVVGDWAYLRTHLAMTVTLPGRAPMRRSGYTLTIMRKESDGRWRLARDANLVMQEA